MTKADKLASNGRELVEPIETLIEGLYRSDVAIGTIVPVVCGPRIANVGRVALFAIFHAIRQAQQRMVKEVDARLRCSWTEDDEARLAAVERQSVALRRLEGILDGMLMF